MEKKLIKIFKKKKLYFFRSVICSEENVYFYRSLILAIQLERYKNLSRKIHLNLLL